MTTIKEESTGKEALLRKHLTCGAIVSAPAFQSMTTWQHLEKLSLGCQRLPTVFNPPANFQRMNHHDANALDKPSQSRIPPPKCRSVDGAFAHHHPIPVDATARRLDMTLRSSRRKFPPVTSLSRT